jgi:uncharacterized membrane protein
MVLMALDHVRDYFHITGNTDDPLNLLTTTPSLFFTRWITHFCAPIFVFLSGVSIYLQSQKKTQSELSGFLIKRGAWLIFVELFLVSLAWTFNPQYNYFILGVIWSIGISMVILGLLIRLPFGAILGIGLVIVLGHNLLDIPESAKNFKTGFWWDLFHHGFFVIYPIIKNHSLMIIYPFLPWTGLMIMGYSAGRIFSKEMDCNQRRKRLFQIGLGLVVSFILIRYLNGYGDPAKWTSDGTFSNGFFSFLKVTKYPPSLAFMCLTIGVAFLLLAALERTRNKLADIFKTYGRVAFFYYILHLYLIHILTVIAFFGRGHSWEQAMKMTIDFPFFFLVPGEGFGLLGTYGVWLFVVVSLYPLCKWYDAYKTRHKEKWWLSYL